MNQITLLGRVGQDPQIKTFEDGALANFSLATDDSYKDKSGQKVERTDWHNVTVRGAMAKVVEAYVRKGKRVLVQGKVKTRKYAAQDGTDRYVTEVHASNIQIIDWPEKEYAPASAERKAPEPVSQKQNTDWMNTPAGDDDLPF